MEILQLKLGLSEQVKFRKKYYGYARLHVPVIWATQVLESLNKSGLATRSEITDAVHASAADCIMLNKGPHTIETLETLKEILKKINRTQKQKAVLARPLNIAGDYIKNLNAL